MSTLLPGLIVHPDGTRREEQLTPEQHTTLYLRVLHGDRDNGLIEVAYAQRPPGGKPIWEAPARQLATAICCGWTSTSQVSFTACGLGTPRPISSSPRGVAFTPSGASPRRCPRIPCSANTSSERTYA
jgi:hypothetical protein